MHPTDSEPTQQRAPQNYTCVTPDIVSTIHHDTYPAISPSLANLTGKVILIAGASRSIGRSIAVAFAEARASTLVLLARSDASETGSAARAATRPGAELKILSVVADVTDPMQTQAAVERVRQEIGRLDILVNNAGLCDPMTTLMAESDPVEWWRIWEVNVRGVYNMTRAALPLLLNSERGEKTVVNIVSTAVHWTLPTFSAYCVSKLAALRFTEQLAVEYGDRGLIALAVHPCAAPIGLSFTLPAYMQERLEDTPELAAHTIVWLVNERRDWLSGRYFSSLWDVDEVLAKREEIVREDKLKMRMAV